MTSPSVEWHDSTPLNPPGIAGNGHFPGRTQRYVVARGLHFDSMQSYRRIGDRRAVNLESRFKACWKCEKLGFLPFFRGVPTGVEPDGMECDD